MTLQVEGKILKKTQVQNVKRSRKPKTLAITKTASALCQSQGKKAFPISSVASLFKMR
jgi:hypothetical protein